MRPVNQGQMYMSNTRDTLGQAYQLVPRTADQPQMDAVQTVVILTVSAAQQPR